jgi:hypothetical protein
LQQLTESVCGPASRSPLGPHGPEHVVKLVASGERASRPIGGCASQELGHRRAFLRRGTPHKFV